MKKYLVAAFGDGGYSTIVEGVQAVRDELAEMLCGDREAELTDDQKETIMCLLDDIDTSESPFHSDISFEDGSLEIIEVTHKGNTSTNLGQPGPSNNLDDIPKVAWAIAKEVISMAETWPTTMSKNRRTMAKQIAYVMRKATTNLGQPGPTCHGTGRAVEKRDI